MASESLIDRVAAPIPGDNPAGINTRSVIKADSQETVFGAIKSAANEARRIEKKAELAGGPEVKEEDRVERGQSLKYWKLVAEQGKEVLATQSKDLEIASFVIEAVTRLEGFQGLAEAFHWTRLLVDGFWDHLYPFPDEDDGPLTPANRVTSLVNPLERLSGSDGPGLLIGPLTWMELTESKGDGPFCVWQFKQALDLDKLDVKEREIRVGRGNITKAQFDVALRDSSTEFCQKLVQNTEACVSEYKSLNDAVAKKILTSGQPKTLAPTSSSLTEALNACAQQARTITKGRVPSGQPAQQSANLEAESAKAPAAADRASGKMRSREDAFAVLNQVADFFESLEPQSLLPYQLRKLVRQGRMKPAEYYLELIDNPQVGTLLLKSCGIDVKSDPKANPKSDK